MNAAHVMEKNLAPIPPNSVPEAGQSVDEKAIAGLEK